MRLLKSTLRNFKKLKEFTFEPNGNDIRFYGDNGTCKTTIADSSSWLLTGKDSLGKSVFDIKTLVNGVPLHNLNHEVENTYEHGGKVFTLKRVYKEKWTSPKNKPEPEMTGHTTDYFIDDVPKTESEYKAFISSLASEEVFKLLTNPLYFNDNKLFPWEKRRTLLFEVCGDYTDAEIITSNKKLAKLPEILRGKLMDEYKKMATAQLKKAEEEKKEKPVRINQEIKGLADVSELDEDVLTTALQTKNNELEVKKEHLLQLRSGGEAAELKIKLGTIQAEIIGLANNYKTSLNELVGEMKTELVNLEMNRDHNLKRNLAELQNGINLNTGKVKDLTQANERLRTYYKTVSAKTLEFSQETVCPTCGQGLPEEQLTGAKEKAEASFNLGKASELEAINADGLKNKLEIETLTKAIEDDRKQLNDLTYQIEDAEKKIDALQKSIGNVTAENTLENFPGYADKLNEKSAVEAEMTKHQSGNSEAAANVNQECRDINAVIEGIKADLNKFTNNKDGQKRIKGLEDQEKFLAEECQRLEQHLFLCDEFTRTKSSMLEEKINSKFSLVSFKLFETQVNGGIKECCEVIVDGIPYSTGLNSGSQINAGIDVINTLSKHFKFIAPTIIDGRESVTKLIDTEAQVISLIVSEPDKKLRVEIEKTAKAEVA
jgi:hypothetical protein